MKERERELSAKPDELCSAPTHTPDTYTQTRGQAQKKESAS